MRIASLSACSALLLVLAACGGAEEPGAIPRDTAEALAARSEQVAAALERGDRCEADRLADVLARESEAADVPEAAKRELLASTRSLAAEIDCPPPQPPAPPAGAGGGDDDDDNENDDDDKGEGEGKGKDKGKGKGRGG